MLRLCIDCSKLLNYTESKRCRKCYLLSMSKTRIGENNPCWRGGSSITHCLECGKKLVTSKGKKKMCRSCIDMLYRWGKKNPNWRGGIAFEPYPCTFNQQLKDKIRVRDNFICQLCNIPELELEKRLSVHHIDYDKKNCNEDNLISLCTCCNFKVNGKREYWENYFKEKIKCIKNV